MEEHSPEAYNGRHGTTIYACRNAETFTIRISDANDVEIGAIKDVTNVPNGLTLAEGYIMGYYKGFGAGRFNLYDRICEYLGQTPEVTLHDVTVTAEEERK